jgi:hypothetical protein
MTALPTEASAANEAAVRSALPGRACYIHGSGERNPQ